LTTILAGQIIGVLASVRTKGGRPLVTVFLSIVLALVLAGIITMFISNASD
jgi:hypothetical protein